MSHVLTLISEPATGALDEGTASAIRDVLPKPAEHTWLSPGEACDIPFTPDTGTGLADIMHSIRTKLGDAPIDAVVQPAGNRRKRLLVADMDSTLIGQECIDELADYAGLKLKIAAITERAMRGELEFEPALRERVGLLEGLDETVLHQVFAERVTLTAGARALARTMQTHGGFTVIVSGGFTFFSERVADAAGFDVHQANVLGIEDGRLTGRVADPVLGRQAKLDALLHYRDKLELAPEDTMAVGDGANDLAMLAEAGLGVAYHAKPVVAAEAQARIDHCALTALLYVQGYARSEFVED